MSGTYPIVATKKTKIENLSSGELYTDVDIFTSNYNTTVQNNIIDTGNILPGCTTDQDFNFPLYYTGVNTITGTINGPQNFEAHFDIESSNAFVDMRTVKFDGGTSVTLLENTDLFPHI